MNKTIFSLVIFLTLISSISMTPVKKKFGLVSECGVSQFYEYIEPESDVKALTINGELEDVELLLVPTRLDVGVYEIRITRKGSNIYKLEGTKFYIETRYCYEYATNDEAILKVENAYGYTKGTIYF